MTLEKMIKRCEGIEKRNKKMADFFKSCKGYSDPRSSLAHSAKVCDDFAKEYHQFTEYLKDYKRLLEQTTWIPVSEGLPEDRDWYLGIFKESDTGWINPLPFICEYLLGKKTKATTKEGWILKGFTDREEYIDYYFNLECVAWMPLPEPYKTESEDKE